MRPVGRVAELGSLGGSSHRQERRLDENKLETKEQL